jgi:hypothetical protein
MMASFAQFARNDAMLLRYTRAALTQKLRKQIADLLPLGLYAMWGSAAVAEAKQER